eukprot:GFUD01014377.1.p1 GENE.GFUD01014377.1~~GFUD01014377.1.p1  ORF type:complete len:332 (-),score=107.73 GFUD01014377.1:13-1008(-)
MEKMYSIDLSEEENITEITEGDIQEEKKPGMKTNILSKIFRQNEILDSIPTGLPLDLSDLSQYGLLATGKCQAVQIPCPGGEGFLKAWFMESEKAVEEEKVIFYSHGVSNTRGAYYRVALYNVLLTEGFKVLAYDYRGFGDSSKVDPTESTVVQDFKTALEWLRGRSKENTKIVAWGHSLGAAITCHALADEFNEKGNKAGVEAVILEAPFNNMVDELKVAVNDVHNVFIKTIVKVFCRMGGLGKMTKDYDIAFQSDKWISHIPCPVMVLAAEDDAKIPVTLTIKLVDQAKKAGKENMTFHKFDASCGLGHKDIFKCEKLPALVKEFSKSL